MAAHEIIENDLAHGPSDGIVVVETVGTGRCAEPRPRTTQGYASANANTKCDWRVNFRGMWGHVRLRSDTWMCEFPGVESFSRRSLTGPISEVALQFGLLICGSSHEVWRAERQVIYLHPHVRWSIVGNSASARTVNVRAFSAASRPP